MMAVPNYSPFMKMPWGSLDRSYYDGLDPEIPPTAWLRGPGGNPFAMPSKSGGPTLESLQLQLMQQAIDAGKSAAASKAVPPIAQSVGKGLFAGGSKLATFLGASPGGALATGAGALAVGLPVAGLGLLAHGRMMRDKRRAQRERRNIKTQAGIELGQETQAITEAALGTARRMGSDVAAVAAANGMGGSGPALNAVLQNRSQIMSGIPDQIRAARAAIRQREQERLDATGDGTEVPAMLLRTLLPHGGDFLRGAFSK